ncbi:phytoene desaturase [Alteribacter lacisalsi]|uniref:4,4'-diaponeurosporene oxygenase n=1 Tax=Alteribacter lacisalsi TaxID=2045244 RepID=A0A2W0H9J8_9BACI|nr:phytoene desaturase family protein [Alteribacter lacisalsi]PYZ98524.1 phytoene desaturase [Alteribacter lacisalsi]
MTRQKKIAVIGAGLGGLAASIRLASKGADVTLYEKNSYAGGKLHSKALGTHTFDFGPNTITMPHVFQNVLYDAGENPDDYFRFDRLTTHTKNVFSDGTSFHFSSDTEKMEEEIASIDPDSALRYREYLKQVEDLYIKAETHFLRRTFRSWKDYMSLPLARALFSVKPLTSLDRFHRTFFPDDRVRQAFNRYATYIGSSPYRSPATFGLIGHLELNDGVYFTRGGNAGIAKGLHRAAVKLGVTMHFNTEVTGIEVADKKASAVKTDHYEPLPVDGIVLNGDLLTQVPALIDQKNRKHLTDEKINSLNPSISAFVILAAAEKRYDLHHHHVFFTSDYRKEFNTIFEEGKYPADPTIYICTSSKTEPSLSPDGDNLFILVNAPPLPRNGTLDDDKEQYAGIVFERLREKGIDLFGSLKGKQIISPADIAEKFYAYRGSLYGIASNKRSDTFLRPFNQSADVGNLFFAGGSTHPGGGSPMVVLSGRNAADALLNELGRH